LKNLDSEAFELHTLKRHQADYAKEETNLILQNMLTTEEAKTAEVQFIGRAANLADCPFPDGVKTIRDLNELDVIVEELLCQ
jgi:hypothetical protein